MACITMFEGAKYLVPGRMTIDNDNDSHYQDYCRCLCLFACVVASAIDKQTTEDTVMIKLTRHHRYERFSKKLPAMLLATGFGFAAAPALAAECQITYSDYEDGIPHVDLATCPDNMPDEDTGFCRLAFDGVKATVFAFHYGEDDACLAGIKQYPAGRFLTK